MSGPARVVNDGRTMTVRVPMVLRKRGGRKVVVVPAGRVAGAFTPAQAGIESALVRALARAHRWRRLLESGAFPTIADLARAEKVNSSYLSRVLRLTLLAPDIVEAMTSGRQPAVTTLASLMRPFPLEWDPRRG